MATDLDPFTEVALAMWRVIEAEPTLIGKVRPGNRIAQLDERTGVATHPKEEISDGDLPQIRIRPSISPILQFGRDVRIAQGFDLMISHDAEELDAGIYPLKWGVIRAFAREMATYQCNLGLDFVEGWKVESYTDDESTLALLKGLSGWTALFTIVVNMNFVTEKII